jgi:predicted extracellular nuclease
MKKFIEATLLCCSLLAAQVLAAQTLEIWQIQGDGLSSPFEGERVTTTGNVVTAVGVDLFFMQTPDGRSDRNPWTSDGIVVDLGSRPQVAVGDLVDVTGTVREDYGQTELAGGPMVTIIGSGNSRPLAVTLDHATPTPLQPWPETELERFEGMWVTVHSGVVTAPSDRFGEACMAAGGNRLFREPGILWPGLPDLTVWDGNPEAFEIDPYGLGEEGTDLAAGTAFWAEGVLAFEFGAYQLWPVNFEEEAEPLLPRPAPVAATGEVTVGTQNLLQLGDPGDEVPLTTRLTKLSGHIRTVLGSPDVLAVQEARDLEVLEDLAERIVEDDPGVRYQPILLEGQDYSDIDVGFLVRDSVEVRSYELVGADARLSVDGSTLFDRPPLVLEAVLPLGSGGLEVTLVAIHLRSLGGIEDPEDGDWVRQKRFEQSVWLSEWIQERQAADPSDPLIVLGDYNAYEFSDGYVDVLGQVSGVPDPDGALLSPTEGVDPELVNWVLRLPRWDRYTFIYRCSAEVLDHILTNRAATPWVRRVVAARGNADAPHDLELDEETVLRSSDHDGLVLYLGPRTRRATGARREPVPPGKVLIR